MTVAVNPMLGATDHTYGVGVWVARINNLRGHIRLLIDHMPEDATWLRNQAASAIVEADRYLRDAAPDTYRGWIISYDYPPIPTRAFDWSATHPDYDGAEDANGNRHVTGQTRDAVIAEINLWHEERCQ